MLDLLDKNIPGFSLATMEREQTRLTERLQQFGQCHDAPEIWAAMNLAEPDGIADLGDEDFQTLTQAQSEANHAVR